MRTKKWLASAKHLNNKLTIIPNEDLTIAIDIIVKLTNIVKQPNLVGEALQCILANLYINLQLDLPTMISLQKANWAKSKNVDISWASYTSISKLLKILYKLKYIDRVKGFFGENKKYCGKYWLRSDTKLIETLDKCVIKKIIPVTDIISLRDKNGFSIKYNDTNRSVKTIKRSLRAYNKNINNKYLTFNCKLQSIYDDNPKKFDGRFTKISYLLNTNQITLVMDGIIIDRIQKIDNSFFLLIPRYNNTVYNTNSNTIYSSIQLHYQRLGHMTGISNDIRYINAFLNDIYLTGEILHKSLFRVFNRSSFDFGGRFYGGAYQNISKIVRDSFKINGEETVSLDYSGMHIRAAYHLIDLDFTGECYVYKKGENDIAREEIKMASLSIINAKNKKTLIQLLTDNRKGAGLKRNKAEKLIEIFDNHHKPIKQFLYSDIGIILQNYDSMIMNNILSILVDKDIPALPIHDEIICQRQHEEFVRETMTTEYQKIMGFKPVID